MTTQAISPELARKALAVESANVLKKLQGGKTLNASERALIQSIADGEGPESAKAWAANQVELAEAIGVSRQSVNRWLKLKRNGPPKPRSDGRFSVPDWKKWLRETGRDNGVTGDELADELPRLNAKRVLLVNERLELDNAERRGELISRAEVIKEAAEIATSLRSALYGEAASLAKAMMMATDMDAAVKTYNESIDRILSTLTQGLKATRQPIRNHE